ncbi:MAG TPA: adenylate/guanylate cyclase domain-containing protein [Candidatus Eremiobacteraceae bacterium]|nr:adenylate/guanylate cyclase domain-containing protein [Candidatus Eremiobacteraceae bacterium]
MHDDTLARTLAPGSTSLPSGAVAFLFTDIEGSTQRWEQHHDAMRDAVARHDALLRGEIESHGGFVFKTVGDAFCAAFPTAQQALLAATSAQRGLSKEDFSAVDGIRVRMGIHAGTAVERDSDYFGPTVNRVARLMSIGHGGQVLVSEAVHDAFGDRLLAGASFVDLGIRRLKDLMQPERVWQVTVEGLPAEFAPLASLDARPNNLPVQSTALLGREHELDIVRKLVASHRLVTISGAGGVGKTKLALQTGADLIDHYERGVWFADLAPIADGGLVQSAVAQTLGVSQAGDSIESSVLRFLQKRQLLLILDNCEHVLGAVAPLADAILKACPNVRMLATSRQPLEIDGECVHRLPSLSVPSASTATTADEALSHGATALFVERAKAVDNRFSLTDETAPIVADICRHLDGIPLAIELAAARVKVLSLPSLSKRLDERFKILTGGSRTAMPRQKTLTALIDWSYGLLERPEQLLFCRLGVFAGGFSLEAASAVCPGDGVDDADILDLLTSLVDKSLVLAEIGTESERYRLLESTRAYALGKLADADELDRFTRGHAEYYRTFAVETDVIHRAQAAEKWLSRHEVEIDNLRSALIWALQQRNDIPLGAAIAIGIVRLWQAAGLAAEARRWLALALELLDSSAYPVAHADLMLAHARINSGERCYEMASAALEMYERTGNLDGVGDALCVASWHSHMAGRNQEAADAIARALTIYRERGYDLGIAVATNLAAIFAKELGDIDTARALYRECLERLQALGDERRVGGLLTNLGALEITAGDFVQADRDYAEALSILSHKKNAEDLVIVYGNIVHTRALLGDLAGARDAGRSGLRLALEMCDERYTAELLLDLGSVAARAGRLAGAGRLFGFARRRFQSLGVGPVEETRASFQITKKALDDGLEAAEIERLTAEGAAWTEKQAVDEAMEA